MAQNFDYQTGNYGTVFRQLNPVINGQPLYTIDGDYATWNSDVYDIANYEQALQVSFAQRDTQKTTSDLATYNFSELGRIVCFTTKHTTHDGAAIVDSRCFVDESDVPPIDTWFFLQTSSPPYNPIYHHRPVLFCWIPKEFELIMQQAIDVEMMKSYTWLDEAEPRLYQRILAAMSA
ncbi:MAG: hypothetical protein ACRYFX_14305 [Janthinobacterium lividum]